MGKAERTAELRTPAEKQLLQFSSFRRKWK